MMYHIYFYDKFLSSESEDNEIDNLIMLFVRIDDSVKLLVIFRILF